MDIRIDTQTEHFKFRVSGLLQYKDKYMFVRIKDNDFLCLPGGHVEINEDTDTAIKREMKEEIGVDVKIDKLITVVQNFFSEKGKVYHELAYYYLVSAEDESKLNVEDYVFYENDKGEIKKLEFKWLDKENLKNYKYKPEFLGKMINSEMEFSVIWRDENKFHCE